MKKQLPDDMWMAQILAQDQKDIDRYFKFARRLDKQRLDLIEVWNLKPRNC